MKPYIYRTLIRAVNESAGAEAFQYEVLTVNVVNKTVNIEFVKTNDTSLRAKGNQFEVIYLDKRGFRAPEGITKETFKRSATELLEKNNFNVEY